jgi:hypothetical protein
MVMFWGSCSVTSAHAGLPVHNKQTAPPIIPYFIIFFAIFLIGVRPFFKVNKNLNVYFSHYDVRKV